MQLSAQPGGEVTSTGANSTGDDHGPYSAGEMLPLVYEELRCTISVDDLDATSQSIAAAGGQVTMQPFRIEGVGTLIMFVDTEGNRAGAMRYDPGVL